VYGDNITAISPQINSKVLPVLPKLDVSNNTVSKNSDFEGYKVLAPPKPIIKTELVNSNPLSTNNAPKKQLKYNNGSHTIGPFAGERLYRQGIESLEKKRSREHDMEILNKLEKMVHPKIPEFIFSQKEDFLESVKKNLKKEEKNPELKPQKEAQELVAGPRDKAKKTNVFDRLTKPRKEKEPQLISSSKPSKIPKSKPMSSKDVHTRLFEDGLKKQREEIQKKKEEKEKEKPKILPKVPNIIPKKINDINVFERLYPQKKNLEDEPPKFRPRSRSAYSQRSTSPCLSIPDSPSRPDSPMSTISEPPWETFSSNELMISSELEQFLQLSPIPLGEMLQELQEDEEVKNTIIEQNESEELIDGENEVLAINVELKPPDQQ